MTDQTDLPLPSFEYSGLLPGDITAFLAFAHLFKANVNPVLRRQAQNTLESTFRRHGPTFVAAVTDLARGETVDARDNTFIHQAVHYLALYGIQCDSLGAGEGFTAFTLSESLR